MLKLFYLILVCLSINLSAGELSVGYIGGSLSKSTASKYSGVGLELSQQISKKYELLVITRASVVYLSEFQQSNYDSSIGLKTGFLPLIKDWNNSLVLSVGKKSYIENNDLNSDVKIVSFEGILSKSFKQYTPAIASFVEFGRFGDLGLKINNKFLFDPHYAAELNLQKTINSHDQVNANITFIFD